MCAATVSIFYARHRMEKLKNEHKNWTLDSSICGYRPEVDRIKSITCKIQGHRIAVRVFVARPFIGNDIQKPHELNAIHIPAEQI